MPWAITFGRPAQELLSAVALSATAFRPSDALPAVLSLQTGGLIQDSSGPEIRAVARLDAELFRGRERLGLLARARDLLPGQVVIFLTGRDPDGKILPAGPYRLRLVAVPTSGGPATTRTITFRVK